jgi:hypothetical protein
MSGTAFALKPDTQRLLDDIGTLANSLGQKTFDMLTCDADCMRNKNLNLLKYKFEEKVAAKADIPYDLSEAERQYIIYKDGEESYNTMITDRFATTAQEYRKNSIEKQRLYMRDLTQILKQYQSERVMVIHTEDLLKQRTKENEDLLKSYYKFERIAQTNERKVVYENKDMEGLLTLRRILLFFYYLAIITYLVYGNFFQTEQYKEYSAWIILVIAVAIPFILNIVVKWLFVIKAYLSYLFTDMPYKDVYADLDEDATIRH